MPTDNEIRKWHEPAPPGSHAERGGNRGSSNVQDEDRLFVALITTNAISRREIDDRVVNDIEQVFPPGDLQRFVETSNPFVEPTLSMYATDSWSDSFHPGLDRLEEQGYGVAYYPERTVFKFLARPSGGYVALDPPYYE